MIFIEKKKNRKSWCYEGKEAFSVLLTTWAFPFATKKGVASNIYRKASQKLTPAGGSGSLNLDTQWVHHSHVWRNPNSDPNIFRGENNTILRSMSPSDRARTPKPHYCRPTSKFKSDSRPYWVITFTHSNRDFSQYSSNRSAESWRRRSKLEVRLIRPFPFKPFPKVCTPTGASTITQPTKTPGEVQSSRNAIPSARWSCARPLVLPSSATFQTQPQHGDRKAIKFRAFSNRHAAVKETAADPGAGYRSVGLFDCINTCELQLTPTYTFFGFGFSFSFIVAASRVRVIRVCA